MSNTPATNTETQSETTESDQDPADLADTLLLLVERLNESEATADRLRREAAESKRAGVIDELTRRLGETLEIVDYVTRRSVEIRREMASDLLDSAEPFYALADRNGFDALDDVLGALASYLNRREDDLEDRDPFADVPRRVRERCVK